MSFDKKEYQRAYMRKKREKNLSGGVKLQTDKATIGQSRSKDAAPLTPRANDRTEYRGTNRVSSGSSAPPAQNNLPVPVLAQPSSHPPNSGGNLKQGSGEARESTITGTTHSKVVESRGGQSFSYDKKKYPNRGAWEIAVERVERAIRYAQMFPNLIGSDDLKFQIIDWQYQNEGIKASCK